MNNWVLVMSCSTPPLLPIRDPKRGDVCVFSFIQVIVLQGKTQKSYHGEERGHFKEKKRNAHFYL